jgi:2-phospho-L-lactate guanylyltransferase
MTRQAPRVAIIVPVGTLEASKSRLGDALDAEEREALAERLLARTLGACLTARGVADVLLISPDRSILRRAADLGARTLRQRTVGLNNGLAEAREDVSAGGAEAILVLPIDLAFIDEPAITDLATTLAGFDEPTVLLIPDRHGTGTNVLGLYPPDVIPFAFGLGSREAHRAAAAQASAGVVELDGPLSFDIDTPADLVSVDALRGNGLHAG